MPKVCCQHCQHEIDGALVEGFPAVCPACGHLFSAVWKTRCQHCHQIVEGYPKTCPYCEQPLATATGTYFLGQTVPFLVRSYVADYPEQAKKKISPYLKLCDHFLCSTELALIKIKLYLQGHGALDPRSLEAVEDVLGALQQHILNLTTIHEIIEEAPVLEPTAQKVQRAIKRCSTMLQRWRANNLTAPNA